MSSNGSSNRTNTQPPAQDFLREQNHGDYIADTFPSAESDQRYSKGGRQQAPKNLRALHHEIIRLVLLGWKQSEVAKYLNLTTVTVSNCMSSYKAQNLLRLLTQKRSEATVDLQQVMMGNAPVVHDVLLDAILDPDTPVAVRAKEAREYLGICGFVKPQKIQATSIHAHLTVDEIEAIKLKARQRAQSAGLLCEDDTEREGPMESVGSSLEVMEGEFVETESAKTPGSSR
jgi:hypothetical protein